jgi:hypothetical protein
MAFTEDQYRQAGEFILANLNDPNVVATRGQELGLSSADILRAAQTVNPNLTAGDVSSYFGNAGLTYKEPTGGLAPVSQPDTSTAGGLSSITQDVLGEVANRTLGQDTVSGGLSVAGSTIPGMQNLVGVDQLALGYNKDATNAANAQNIANQLYAQGQGLIGKTISGDLATQLNSALNPTYFEGEGGLMPTSSSVFSPVRKQVGTDNEGNPIYEDTGTYSAFLNAHDIGNKGTLLGQEVTVDKNGNRYIDSFTSHGRCRCRKSYQKCRYLLRGKHRPRYGRWEYCFFAKS